MKRTKFPFFLILLFAYAPVFSQPWVGNDLQGYPCDGNGQGFGPYDYTNAGHLKNLPIVEAHHFTRKVESLIAGQSSTLQGDMDYTLRAFPNHHRAIYALIRLYTEKHKGKTIQQASREMSIPPPECYIQRGLAFQAKDGVLYALFALYMQKLNDQEEAERYYVKSIKLNPSNSETYYNLGLLLFKQGRYEEAKSSAQNAYRLGYPLVGLKRKLAGVGYPLD